MKCARCATELPGQAQFCMKCGTPVAVAPTTGTVTMARPVASGGFRTPVAAGRRSAPKAALIAAAALLLALLVCGGYFGYRSLMNRGGTGAGNSNVLTAAGRAPDGSGLLNTNGRIGNPSRLTDTSGIPAAPPVDTTDINDYLKFLKEIERERITLSKRNTGDIMALIPLTEGGNAMAMMKDNEQDISRTQNETYSQIQRKMSEISGEWSALSSKFASRRAPQSCQQLANSYYDVLGKTSGAIVAVGTSFSQAMGAASKGDAGGMASVVEKLKGMDGSGTGSASKSVDDACDAADHALADVCDKFHLHKDFDIKPDGGNSSMFGLGR